MIDWTTIAATAAGVAAGPAGWMLKGAFDNRARDIAERLIDKKIAEQNIDKKIDEFHKSVGLSIRTALAEFQVTFKKDLNGTYALSEVFRTVYADLYRRIETLEKKES